MYLATDEPSTSNCLLRRASRHGRAKDIRQRLFAISVERKIKTAAIAAICEGTRRVGEAAQDVQIMALPPRIMNVFNLPTFSSREHQSTE